MGFPDGSKGDVFGAFEVAFVKFVFFSEVEEYDGRVFFEFFSKILGGYGVLLLSLSVRRNRTVADLVHGRTVEADVLVLGLSGCAGHKKEGYNQ